MDREDDFRRLTDMLWRGEPWMYDDPIRRANSGDPFWWAALSIIADHRYGGICGSPTVSYVTNEELRTIGAMKMMPLAYEWRYDPDADKFGTLYKPSNRTDLGYVVRRVDFPPYSDLIYRMMNCVLEIDSMILCGARELPDSDQDSFNDFIRSTTAMLSVELNVIGGPNAHRHQ